MSNFFTLEVSDPEFENENIRHVTVKSPALQHRADITLFIPPARYNRTADMPIVLLLHGVYGSHWAWVHNGGVHRTALKLIKNKQTCPFILAMPSDGLWKDGSGYLPNREQNFEKWIVEDVVQATIEVVEQATSASPLFIAGLSMGGFGALRLAAKYPKRFRAASGLSSVTEFDQLRQFMEEDIPMTNIQNADKSIFAAMQKNRDRLPPLRFDCGIDDPLLDANRTLHQQLQEIGVNHEYEEFPGGHDWHYWSRNIETTLLFFNQFA